MKLHLHLLLCLFFATPLIATSVELVGLEHDLVQTGKSARIHLKVGDDDYVLHDHNGGSTFILLYDLMMTNVQAEMKGLKPGKAKAKWKEIKLNQVKDKDHLQSILIHTCNRLITSFDDHQDKDLMLVRLFKQRLEQRPFLLDYSTVYQFMGEWLRNYIDTLPACNLVHTNEMQHMDTLRVRFNNINLGDKDLNNIPVLKCLRHIATLSKFEARNPEGTLPLVIKDIKTIMALYNQNRLNEVDIREEEYVTIVTDIIPLSNGTIIETRAHIPKNKDQKEKDATKRKGSKSKRKKTSGSGNK